MKRFALAAGIGLLWLSACGGGGEPETAPDPAAAAGKAAEPETGNGAPAAQAAPAMPDCPFRDTSEWVGSVEGGRVLVNGRVDLMMAGFRPELSRRPGAPAGTLALDLALAPDPQAAVNDRARYQAAGSYRRGEIWCGGERIAGFDMIMVE
jgi:hypothetical protein